MTQATVALEELLRRRTRLSAREASQFWAHPSARQLAQVLEKLGCAVLPSFVGSDGSERETEVALQPAISEQNTFAAASPSPGCSAASSGNDSDTNALSTSESAFSSPSYSSCAEDNFTANPLPAAGRVGQARANAIGKTDTRVLPKLSLSSSAFGGAGGFHNGGGSAGGDGVDNGGSASASVCTIVSNSGSSRGRGSCGHRRRHNIVRCGMRGCTDTSSRNNRHISDACYHSGSSFDALSDELLLHVTVLLGRRDVARLEGAARWTQMLVKYTVLEAAERCGITLPDPHPRESWTSLARFAEARHWQPC